MQHQFDHVHSHSALQAQGSGLQCLPWANLAPPTLPAQEWANDWDGKVNSEFAMWFWRRWAAAGWSAEFIDDELDQSDPLVTLLKTTYDYAKLGNQVQLDEPEEPKDTFRKRFKRACRVHGYFISPWWMVHRYPAWALMWLLWFMYQLWNWLRQFVPWLSVPAHAVTAEVVVYPIKHIAEMYNHTNRQQLKVRERARGPRGRRALQALRCELPGATALQQTL